MNWYKDFYEQQFKWLNNIANYDTDTLREDLIEKVMKYSDKKSPKKLLELGAGSGQFAVAAAKQGFEVTIIEISPSAIEQIHQLANLHQVSENINVIHGDFYQVSLEETFDIVCYWDGFGIGTDQDQIYLLSRINHWLKINGSAFIDIYTPWYWGKVVGQTMKIGDYISHYDFDAYECRMLNSVWLEGNEEHKITQSLRCYSPVDLQLLLNDTNLELKQSIPSGEMDYEKWKYHPDVPLERAMTFLAILVKK